MSREIHVRFWEGVGVRFPRATRLRTGVLFQEEQHECRIELHPCLVQERDNGNSGGIVGPVIFLFGQTQAGDHPFQNVVAGIADRIGFILVGGVDAAVGDGNRLDGHGQEKGDTDPQEAREQVVEQEIAGG
jgi:hypothetical protein